VRNYNTRVISYVRQLAGSSMVFKLKLIIFFVDFPAFWSFSLFMIKSLEFLEFKQKFVVFILKRIRIQVISLCLCSRDAEINYICLSVSST